MTSADPPTQLPEPEHIASDLASSLLRLGLSKPRRPVDELIDRLHAPDGGNWLDRALLAVLPGGVPAREAIVGGEIDLDTLRVVKERSKRLLKGTPDRETKLTGIAGYFLAIAAGLQHHATQIGGRTREELDPILLDLATAAPSPYRELLADATLVRAVRDENDG